jgi:hypothetical protein
MRPQAWDLTLAAPAVASCAHARLHRTACEPHAARRLCCGAAPARLHWSRIAFSRFCTDVSACVRRSYIFLDATVGALGFYLLGYGFAYGDSMKCVAERRRSAALAHCCCATGLHRRSHSRHTAAAQGRRERGQWLHRQQILRAERCAPGRLRCAAPRNHAFPAPPRLLAPAAT